METSAAPFVLFALQKRKAGQADTQFHLIAGPAPPSHPFRRKKIFCIYTRLSLRRARAGRNTFPPCDQGRGGKDGQSCHRRQRGFGIQTRPALSCPEKSRQRAGRLGEVWD